jgi:hypothetical protein
VPPAPSTLALTRAGPAPELVEAPADSAAGCEEFVEQERCKILAQLLCASPRILDIVHTLD